MSQDLSSKQPTILWNQYRIDELLGEGAFGTVYKGYDVKENRPIAIKEQNPNAKHANLLDEYYVYNRMQDVPGFLTKLAYVNTAESRSYLVFNLIDRNLDLVMNDRKEKKLDLKSTIMIAIQLIKNIQALHQKDYTHRDIKPENIAMGLDQDASTVFLFDLGICSSYKTPKGNHINLKLTRSKCLIGTPSYASLNSHHGFEISRRDDIESLAYTLIFFLRGVLPWQDLESDFHRHKQDKIMDQKMKISPEELCRGLPCAFKELLEYARNLDFKTEPDYHYLVSLFDDLMIENGFEYDNVYPWTKETDSAMIELQKKKDEEKDRNALVEIKSSSLDYPTVANNHNKQQAAVTGQENKSIQPVFIENHDNNKGNKVSSGKRQAEDKSSSTVVAQRPPPTTKSSIATRAQKKIGGETQLSTTTPLVPPPPSTKYTMRAAKKQQLELESPVSAATQLSSPPPRKHKMITRARKKTVI